MLGKLNPLVSGVSIVDLNYSVFDLKTYVIQ